MAVIEQRYAGVLAGLVAHGKADAGELRRELAAVTAMLRESSPLREVLASPAVNWEHKRRLLEALVARARLSHLTRNILLVVAQHGRMAYLPGIAAALDSLLLQQQGIVQTEIAGAREFSPEERAEIERQLQAVVGLRLQATYRRDPDLLGGFLARVGDRVFDGSIRGRLQRLRQVLTSA